MSTSGPRYHIPFPRAFLSLNTPIQKPASANAALPTEPETPSHSFLSNRASSRSFSISSVSSSGSAVSPPSSPPTMAAESPVLEAKVPTFLPLNSKKFTPPPAVTAVKTLDVEKSPFLSNKH